MKNIFILLSLLAPATVFATIEYTMNCDDAGSLTNFTVNYEAQDCPVYTSQGMACGDTKSESSGKDKISLRSIVDHYYATRDSKDYDKNTVQEIIKTSVCNGADPYLSLALIMVESPPVSPTEMAYLDDYGIPPLDSIAAFDSFQCSVQKTLVKRSAMMSQSDWDYMNSPAYQKEPHEVFAAKPRLIKILKKGDSYTGFDYSGNDRTETTRTVTASGEFVLVELRSELTAVTSPRANAKNISLLGASEKTGQVLDVKIGSYSISVPADYKIATKASCEGRCCRTVVAPKGMAWADVQKALANKQGYSFIEDKFRALDRLPHVHSFSDPYDRFANLVQGYNGYGLLGGKREQFSNKCLTGIDTRKTPIYGAGVGELMTNSIMANSEIRDMVISSMKTCGVKNTKSYLCRSFGGGNHQVNPLKFAALQKTYLSGRACKARSYSYKGHSLISMPQNARAEEPAGSGTTAN